MNNKKRNFLISGILLLIAITFTILVKVVDVKQIGVNNSSIGFATLNQFIFETTGVNIIWYHITDWLGLIPVFMAIVYAFIGLIQLIKRRSIFKVDKEIILLGLYYIIVIALYVFFEKVIINYRPILMNGFLEASYPSSHTLMTICICGSSILINKKLFNNKIRVILPSEKIKEFQFKNLNPMTSSSIEETRKILSGQFGIEEEKVWEDIYYIKARKNEDFTYNN